MYIRSTSDILPKCKDMRNSYISPDWNDMRSIAYMNELSEIVDFGRNLRNINSCYWGEQDGRQELEN